jgi:hypothetical protein
VSFTSVWNFARRTATATGPATEATTRRRGQRSPTMTAAWSAPLMTTSATRAIHSPSDEYWVTKVVTTPPAAETPDTRASTAPHIRSTPDTNHDQMLHLDSTCDLIQIFPASEKVSIG